MCGIIGFANLDVSKEALIAMRDAMAHRGPDDVGIFFDRESSVGLGHRRLSILDLSPEGQQPMTTGDGTLQIVFNGEIYNYRELRRGLEGRHRFHSATDTEVILALYAERGIAAFTALNGMYALAIWDSKNGELIVARDPLGIKPLYFVEQGDGFGFASELKGLEPLRRTHRIDPTALAQNLAFQYVPGTRTVFSGVQKVAPGEILRWNKARGLRRERIPPRPASGPISAGVREVRDVVGRAVERQMVSDVPVGCFLSGGLDSSIIAAEMRRALGSGRPVRAYSIGYDADTAPGGLPADSKAVIEAVARKFSIDVEYIDPILDITAALTVENLDRLVWHLEEPIGDAAILNVDRIAKRAREMGTPVLLCGHGADELFGGYRRHIAAQALPVLRRIPAVALSAGGALLGSHRRLRRLSQLLRAASAPAPSDVVRLAFVNQMEDVLPLFHRDVRAQVDAEAALEPHLAAARAAGSSDLVETSQAVDRAGYLVDQNLLYMDKLSMAHSIETRVPYLDDEVVDLALRIHGRDKVRGTSVKRVLRKAFADVLPQEVLRRKKMGFGVHLTLVWKNNGPLDDVVESAARRGWYDAPLLRAMRERARSDEAAAALVYTVVMTELAARRFGGDMA